MFRALLVSGLMMASTATAQTAAPAPTAEPPPAYMIVTGVVNDRAAFGAGYAAKLPPLYARFGGSYLALGSNPIVLEGEVAWKSYVISRWPSVAAAQAFWNSPEYDALRKARIDGKWGEFDVVIVPGLAVPTTVSPMAREAAGAQTGTAPRP